MYRVDIASKKLIELKSTGFSTLGLRERFDIQEWIEKEPKILSDDLLVIGKEVILSSGKRLDLLCINKSAALVIIELKRDDSGSEVEWQAIKYASYCSNFLPDEIFKIFSDYKDIDTGQAEKIIEQFIEEDISQLNQEQRIVLASKEFNSEVISAVLWLRDYGVDIQCTRLSPFLDDDGELFIKPETIIPLPEAKDYIEKKEIKQRVAARQQPEWTGYWFVNVGEGPTRTWNDNQKYNFIAAGGDRKYSDPLKKLQVDDKFYAYMGGRGYVGLARVTHEAIPIRNYIEAGSNKPLLELNLDAENPDNFVNDDDKCEWVVGVEWIKSVPALDAKTFTGIFANQNVVCKLRNKKTLDFLGAEFGS